MRAKYFITLMASWTLLEGLSERIQSLCMYVSVASAVRVAMISLSIVGVRYRESYNRGYKSGIRFCLSKGSGALR